MDHRTPLIVVLLGLGAPALAADIDDVAPFAQSDVPEVVEEGAQSRRTTRTVSNGNKKVKKTTVSNGRGKAVTHVAGTNGTRAIHGSRVSRAATGKAGAQRVDSRGHMTVSDRNGHSVTRATSTHHARGTGPRGGTVEVHRGGVKTHGQVRTTRTVTAAPRPVTAPRTHTTTVRTARPAPPVRTGTTVVTTRPGPATTRVVHASPRVRHSTRTVVYRRVTPVHGVFVFGPPPTHHHHYVHETGNVQVKQKHLPDRAIDRANSLAVGAKAGTLVSGTLGGDVYGDLGVGLLGRYRPAEAVGLQLDLGHHAGRSVLDLNESQRSQTQVAGSVQLFAFPWTRVSPYAVGGVTWNARSLEDTLTSSSATTIVETTDALWGLHGGLGVELAMGDNFALDLEGRYVGWLDRQPEDAPGALQATAGLLFHFK